MSLRGSRENLEESRIVNDFSKSEKGKITDACAPRCQTGRLQLMVAFQNNRVLTMRFSDVIGNTAKQGGELYMAWFDRNPGGKVESDKLPETPKPAPEPPARPVVAAPKPANPAAEVVVPASTAGLIGYLYKGSRVSGQLSFQGPARIDGVVDGEIQCQGTLTIGEGAEVRAKISGRVVVIRGKVEGNVTAREKVELLAPARLTGNIKASRLTITEGVVFDGDCSMGVAKQMVGVGSSQAVSAEKAAAAPAAKLQADSKN
jgi:cytoskeletal protein CcmA (bactofilin family)